MRFTFNPRLTAQRGNKAAVFVGKGGETIEVRSIEVRSIGTCERGEEGGTFKEGVGEGSVLPRNASDSSDANDSTPIDSSKEETSPMDGGLEEGNNDERPTHESVAQVWDCYVRTMEPRNRVLLLNERRLITDALKVASAEECCRAIEGCKRSEFHMGINDRSKKYNKLSNILRGKRGIRTLREQIDLFIDIAEKTGAPAADSKRIRQAKLDVRQAAAYKGNRVVQERGARARQVLEEAGITFEETVDGRLDFRFGR